MIYSSRSAWSVLVRSTHKEILLLFLSFRNLTPCKHVTTEHSKISKCKSLFLYENLYAWKKKKKSNLIQSNMQGQTVSHHLTLMSVLHFVQTFHLSLKVTYLLLLHCSACWFRLLCSSICIDKIKRTFLGNAGFFSICLHYVACIAAAIPSPTS